MFLLSFYAILFLGLSYGEILTGICKEEMEQ